MTQEIQWGPAIAVDGKRPGWLKQTDTVQVETAIGWAGTHYGENPTSSPPIDSWIWAHSSGRPCIINIRLPADHPHYRQTEAAPVDWSGELEAVHEDGRVVAVSLDQDHPQPNKNRHYVIKDEPDDCDWLFLRDGSPAPDTLPGWRIRNVPHPTPQADTKPDLTAEERAIALVIELGSRDPFAVIPLWMVQEARAIVALLPEPVDPDLIEARKMASRTDVNPTWAQDCISGAKDDEEDIQFRLEGIKRGRALEQGNK